MAIDDFDFTPEEISSRLQGLFEAARARDEFEFACTLLRVRGIEDVGWDPFIETQRLVEDLMLLIGGPLLGHTKVRLGLLLYSHLTEVGAMYDVLANLTRVVAGKRYVIGPFLDHYPRNRRGEPQFLSTSGQVRALKEMLGSVDQEAVVEPISWFFHPSLRNAFAHADYTLHGDKFRSLAESFEIDGRRTPELRFDVLADLVNRSLAFYDAFMRQYERQRGAYRTNKVIQGRISGGPEAQSVELLADAERGLYGFRSLRGEPPDCTRCAP